MKAETVDGALGSEEEAAAFCSTVIIPTANGKVS